MAKIRGYKMRTSSIIDPLRTRNSWLWQVRPAAAAAATSEAAAARPRPLPAEPSREMRGKKKLDAKNHHLFCGGLQGQWAAFFPSACQNATRVRYHCEPLSLSISLSLCFHTSLLRVLIKEAGKLPAFHCGIDRGITISLIVVN